MSKRGARAGPACILAENPPWRADALRQPPQPRLICPGLRGHPAIGPDAWHTVEKARALNPGVANMCARPVLKAWRDLLPLDMESAVERFGRQRSHAGT